MSTIDKLTKIDNIAARIIDSLYRCVDWVEDKYEDCLVDATYKAVERKAAAIGKAEDKISELEDAEVELKAYLAESMALLAEKHKAALAALGREVEAKREELRAGLAAAAEARVAAGKAYDAAIQRADEELGVKVKA